MAFLYTVNKFSAFLLENSTRIYALLRVKVPDYNAKAKPKTILIEPGRTQKSCNFQQWNFKVEICAVDYKLCIRSIIEKSEDSSSNLVLEVVKLSNV